MTNHVAIVTGSSRGIGRAIALKLAQDGLNIVVNYQTSTDKAQQVVDEIHTTTQSRAVAVQADVSVLAEGTKLIQETLAAFGRIDVVVFNASLIVFESLSDVTEESFRKVFGMNVKAPMFFTQQVVPHLRPGSRIIVISTSVTTLSTIMPQYFLYCASRGAVEQMVRVLAKDLGRKGITVNSVNPGPTDTDCFHHGKTEEQVKTFAALSPEGRIGLPDDIAGVVSFVASDQAKWINGQILYVNGAMTV